MWRGTTGQSTYALQLPMAQGSGGPHNSQDTIPGYKSKQDMPPNKHVSGSGVWCLSHGLSGPKLLIQQQLQLVTLLTLYPTTIYFWMDLVANIHQILESEDVVGPGSNTLIMKHHGASMVILKATKQYLEQKLLL